ncbi:glycine receptor subunit alphaZ1-like isoform X1 [Branchiostoma floridae x Branchiostoma japonicum]
MDGDIRAALPILAALLSIHTRTSEQYQAENNNRTNYIRYMPTVPPFPGANRTMGYNPTMGPSSLQNSIEEPMFVLPEGYFYWLRPNWEGPPVEVVCSIYIDSLGAFSEKTMDFDLSLILGCQWRDGRLANITSEHVAIPEGMEIWKPSIDVVAKESTPYTSALSVSREGNVLMMQWFTIKATCLMQLHAYPLDHQKCSLLIQNRGGVKIVWGWETFWFPGDTPIVTRTSGLHSQLSLETVESFAYVNSLLYPELICVYQGVTCDYRESENCLRAQCTSVEKITTEQCRTCNYFGGECKNGTDELAVRKPEDCVFGLLMVSEGDLVFTTAELRFSLRRRLSYHMLQIYIPSISIVAMSWVSFWINIESSPARTALGVTTVLTMITQSGRPIPMPEVSYVRAVDVWLLVCQLFVFLALIEYAAVNYISRTLKEAKALKRYIRPPAAKRNSNANAFPTNSNSHPENSVDDTVLTNAGGSNIADTIDHICRWGFPLAFLLFNIMYWVTYNYIVQT